MKKNTRYIFLLFLILTCVVAVPAVLLYNHLTAEPDEIDATVITTASTTTTTTTTITTTTTTTAVTTTTTATTTMAASTTAATSAPNTTTSGVTGTTTAPPSTTTAAPSTTAKPTTTTTTKPKIQTVSFADCLFIGDSRTVGMKEYGKMTDATFFCSVGLNSYSVLKNTVDVAGYGNITLTALLDKKQFKSVYIALGINEIGYNLNTTVGKYEEIINLVKAKQPQAAILVESTLHVTAKKQASDQRFQNSRINEFNSLIAALADNRTVFYLEVNPVYDDADGSMDSKYSGDGVHIKAQYYPLWRDFLDKNRRTKS